MKGFSGGIHPPHHKGISIVNPIKTASIPSSVVIPVLQHIGAPAKPLVKVGSTVKVGTKIAEAQGLISSDIHASISGTVRRIDIFPHPVVGQAQAIVIESDGKDEHDESIKPCTQPEKLSREEIIAKVREAGIVGMGGASFPTHVKLSPPPAKKIDTVIINGAECEPYLTCDHALMLYHSVDILKGACLVMKAVGAERCYIGIEDNKLDAIELLHSKIRLLGLQNIEPVTLPVKYPQGSEKQLIKAITNREVPLGGLPMDVGVVVQNVGTAAAIYEAVYLGKPLYERLVTVCGMSFKTEYNMKIRVGTPFTHVVKEMGGFINPPLKVVMGGPMMGIAQSTLDVPVIKSTSGILCINPGQYVFPRSRPCIRCGRCVEACPMGLVPNHITIAGDTNHIDRAEQLGVRDCMECGSCAYVCPAKRPMVHTIKTIKHELMKRDKKKKETVKA